METKNKGLYLLRTTPELMTNIKQKATEQGRSINKQIEFMLKEQLREEDR